jgi:hypothetical protein
MMPPGGVWRIDRRLIHPSVWKVNSAKSVYGMLQGSTLENPHTFGQDVVSREN